MPVFVGTKATSSKPKLGRRFIMARTVDDSSVIEVMAKAGFKHSTSREPNDYDFVVWSGGADINPFLYGQAPHSTTSIVASRDVIETRMYHKTPIHKPKIGICRGAQLLNVKNGGSMYQNVNKHAGQHHQTLDLTNGQIVTINSVHHQMMIPTDNAVILARALAISTIRETDTTKEERGSNDNWLEPEAIFYPESNSFCFQAHPEYNHPATKALFFSLLAETFDIAS